MATQKKQHPACHWTTADNNYTIEKLVLVFLSTAQKYFSTDGST